MVGSLDKWVRKRTRKSLQVWATAREEVGRPNYALK